MIDTQTTTEEMEALIRPPGALKFMLTNVNCSNVSVSGLARINQTAYELREVAQVLLTHEMQSVSHSFNITTKKATIQGISHRFCTVLNVVAWLRVGCEAHPIHP